MSKSPKHEAGPDCEKEVCTQTSVLPELVTPDYSTLEVVEDLRKETESRFAEHHPLPPQLAFGPCRNAANAPEPLPFDEKELAKDHESVLNKPRRRQRSLLMLTLIISTIVLVVAAAIIGILAGTHKLSLKSVPVNASAESINGCENGMTPPGLAAISWLDSQSNTTYRRVFFQNNNTNVIMQSAWDSDGDGWAIKPVTDASVDVRANSPIAAAVSNDSSGFDIHVFYLGSNDTVYGSYVTDPDDDYTFDNLLMAEGLMADDSTDLAAMWHDCDDCPGTVLLVFQDENQQVKLRNGTFTGTTTKILPVNAMEGSSLAISTLDDADDSGLRLAFESESDSATANCSTAAVLSVATWSDDPDTGIVSWAQENPKIDKGIASTFSGAPLAVFPIGDGTGVLGKLDGYWQVAQLDDFQPVTTEAMFSVPGLKGDTDIAQLAVSDSKDLFLLSASNGSLTHWTLQGYQDEWHFMEQIQTTL